METRNQIQEIKQLIDQYFEGSTSCAEETMLRNYFLQENIATQLIEYRALFIALENVHYRPELFPDISPILKKDDQTKRVYFRKYLARTAVAIGGIAASFILIFLLIQKSTPQNYVMINGEKFTNEEILMQTFDTSIKNVKIEMEDIFSDLQDVTFEE